jgi:hypothetical protein
MGGEQPEALEMDPTAYKMHHTLTRNGRPSRLIFTRRETPANDFPLLYMRRRNASTLADRIN